MFEAIKAEKRMSLKHWRYRLLHWCFNEKATEPEESKLPHYLYTHYCPLFHLTNMIAILIPLIILAKVIAAVCKVVHPVIAYLVDKLAAFLGSIEIRLSDPEVTSKAATLKENQQLITRKILAGYTEFARLWKDYGCCLYEMEEAEAREYFERVLSGVLAAQVRAKEKRQKMRERLVFWSHFSQMFLKWFFNIAYLAAGVFVIWLCYVCTAPVLAFCWDVIVLLSMFDPVWFFLLLGKILVGAAIIAGVAYGFYRFSVLRHGARALGTACTTAVPPLLLVVELIITPIKWTARATSAFVDFVAVFYEENCPPITIVSEDEAQIDAAVDEVQL